MRWLEVQRIFCGDPSRRAGYVLIWAGWLVLLGVAVTGLRSYRVDNALDDWMPHLGSSGLIRSYVVIGGEPSRWDADDAARSLTKLESVSGCLSPAAFSGLSQLSSINPEGLVVNHDGSYTGVICFAKRGVEDELFLHQVQNTLADLLGADADMLAIGGPAVFHVELNRWSQRRLPVVMGLIVVTGFVMLWWMTGSAWIASASVLAVVLSQVILLGVISWMGRPVDMAVSMVPPMMMALGFSYAAHRALRSGVTAALLLCLVTTMAGVGSFATVDVPPIHGFAVYGMIGLALVWAAVMTLVPPLRDDPGHRPLIKPSRWLARVRDRVIAFVERRAWWVVGGAVVVTIAAGILTPRLRFEDNPLHYFPSDARIVTDYATLEQRLTGMLPFHVSVSGPADPMPLLEKADGVRKVIDTRLIEATSSAATYWCLANTDSLSELSRQAKDWRAWAQLRGAKLDWGGVARQLHEIEYVVCRAAMIALPTMLLLVMAVTWLVSRSLLMAAVSVWVNLLPVTVLIVIVTVIDWPIGLPSLMIGAIAIGVAVDDTLHLVSALKGARPKNRMRSVLNECWRPCVGSSFVAAAGMAMFIGCPFWPTAQFGVLLSIAILAALVGDMLVLPAIFQLLEPRRKAYASAMVNDRVVDGIPSSDRGNLRSPRTGSASSPTDA